MNFWILLFKKSNLHLNLILLIVSQLSDVYLHKVVISKTFIEVYLISFYNLRNLFLF